MLRSLVGSEMCIRDSINTECFFRHWNFVKCIIEHVLTQYACKLNNINLFVMVDCTEMVAVSFPTVNNTSAKQCCGKLEVTIFSDSALFKVQIMLPTLIECINDIAIQEIICTDTWTEDSTASCVAM